MTIHDATEQAFLNGYEKGKGDAAGHAYWTIDHSCSHCGQTLEAPSYESTQLWYHTPYCPFCGYLMNGESLNE